MGLEDSASTQEETPITKEFLEKILKRPITDFKLSGGSNPGDNYTSILISIEITVPDQDEPLHLLFKTFPHHPTRQKMLEDSNLFLKEYEVYDLWLPELIKFQTEVIGNPKDNLLLPAMPELVAGAAVDYIKGDPKTWTNMDPMLSNFILMVDVRKTFGFKMENKLNSLGYQHVKVVLEELAKYHALGHAYKTHHKLTTVLEKFRCMEDPFFLNPAQRPMLEGMMKVNMEMVMDACKDFLATQPEIAKSLEIFKDAGVLCDYLQTFLNPNGMDEEEVEGWMRKKQEKYSGKPLKEQWIVAGHGDCWTNNMLFKTDHNHNVTATILVDLQIARESCIMSDLVYFLYSSVDTDFRKKYLDEMLQLYFDKFTSFCKILKVDTFPGFTLDNFIRRFQRSKMVGFVFASMVLPIILQRPETTVNLDKVEMEATDDPEDFAVMFSKMGRDDEDQNLLRGRFVKLMAELHEEGVL